MGAAFVQGTAITLGLHKVAERYGQKAMAVAGSIEDRGALGYLYTAMALQEVVSGRFSSATHHGRLAIAALRESGYWDPRVWGFAMVFTGWWACGFAGNYAEGVNTGRELVRFGEDAGDLQTWCFGLDVLGGTQYWLGDLDQATRNSKKAMDLPEVVPDHATRIVAGSFLGKCNLRNNNLAEAHAILRQTEAYANEYHMNSYFASPFLYNGLAEVCLASAERSEGTERLARLKEAKKRCRDALKSSKSHFRPLFPEAMRLKGTLEWLNGRRVAAERWWSRSLNLAGDMGTRYDLAMTHFEMGRRFNDREHLRQAEAIFTNIGAEFDLAETRKLLEKGQHGRR